MFGLLVYTGCIELEQGDVVMMEWLRNLVAEIGFWESGEIDIRSLNYEPSVREICKGNVCRGYNTSWACPPAVGTLEECKARCEQFDHMLLLSGKFELEDSFDYEGMMAGMQDFKKLTDQLDAAVHGKLSRYQIMSNEGCGRCKKCTWPDAPCRFPEKLHPSLESYGFLVNKLAEQAGMHYINGQNTVTYFGAILYCE